MKHKEKYRTALIILLEILLGLTAMNSRVSSCRRFGEFDKSVGIEQWILHPAWLSLAQYRSRLEKIPLLMLHKLFFDPEFRCWSKSVLFFPL